MTRRETADFMERIRLHYPNKFIVDKIKINTWYNTLQNYNFDELNNKLEAHLKNEEFADKVPSLEFLVRYATPESVVEEDYIMECQKCGHYFENQRQYYKHLDRCIKIATMARDLNKYFDLQIDIQKLDKYNNYQIDELYNRYIDKMLSGDIDLPTERRRVLEKCKIIRVDN